MSDDKSPLVKVVQSQRKYFGISDFEAIESNQKMREYAEAIVQYAQKYGIKVTVREGEQSSETGRLSGLTLQTSGMIGSIRYVAPDSKSKRATIEISLPLQSVSTNLQNFDQYKTGLANLVSQFR